MKNVRLSPEDEEALSRLKTRYPELNFADLVRLGFAVLIEVPRVDPTFLKRRNARAPTP